MRFVVDLHTHTISSGHAYSTVLEMVTEAAEKGLEAMAVTDHGPGMPGAPHMYHFGNMRVLPAKIKGVRLMKGVEANITDGEGNLDLPEGYLKRMDIVLAGMHDIITPYGSIEENTKAMIAAMHNPYVDIIVHPGNPTFAVDYEKIMQAGVDLGVAIEINNSSLCGSRKGSVGNCHHIAALAAQKGNLISIGSDAHFAPDVGRFDEAIKLIAEAGIKSEQLLNTSMDKVNSYLEKRRKARGL